jgi:hypothetical protein
MVALTRIPAQGAPRSLKQVVESVGAVPRRALGWEWKRTTQGLPKVVLKRAHWFLPALARLPRPGGRSPFPDRLALRYRTSLGRVKDPDVRGTLRRVFERTLVIHGAATRGPPHVQMLLEEPTRSALELAERGMALAESTQQALDRLTRSGEADLLADLESLRARAAAHPAQAAALEREAAVKQAVLEQEHLRQAHQLLSVASTLELASVHALGALAEEAAPRAA